MAGYWSEFTDIPYGVDGGIKKTKCKHRLSCQCTNKPYILAEFYDCFVTILPCFLNDKGVIW